MHPESTGLIRVCQGDPYWSLGSIWFVGFDHVRPGDCLVRSRLFVLVRPALGVNGRSPGSSSCALRLAEFVRIGTLGVVEFVGVRLVRSDSSDSFRNVIGRGCALGAIVGVPWGSLVSFWFVLVWVRPRDRWVRSGSPGSAIGVSLFVRVRPGTPCWSLGSFWFVWFGR